MLAKDTRLASADLKKRLAENRMEFV